MGLIDDLAGKAGALFGGAGKGQSNLVDSVVKMIGAQQGGLNGLVAQFTKGGLGDIVGSWVGTGANKAITPQQLTSGLGEDKLQQLAADTGMHVDDVKKQMTTVLPGVVDKLTPDGVVPEGNFLEKGMELLKGLKF